MHLKTRMKVQTMKRFIIWIFTFVVLTTVFYAYAQEDSSCGTATPSQLLGERHAQLSTGQIAPVYDALNGSKVGDFDIEAEPIFLYDDPVCQDNRWWWHIATGEYYDHWMPETVEGVSMIEPFRFIPVAPTVFGIPMSDPVQTDINIPLPTVQPAGNPTEIAFATWDWESYREGLWYQPPDPMALQLPDVYGGDLPVPPVNLDEVYFVEDANLTPEQLALLAQNGFVVVSGQIPQFDDIYQEGWSHQEGKGDFITTDALLHSLFLTYQNALMFLEMNELYGTVAQFVGEGYLAAEAQYQESIGTSLEVPARNAAIYYAVALSLLTDGESSYLIGYNQVSGFDESDLIPSEVLSQADPTILELAHPMIQMARAAEGRIEVPMLEQYEEDFSQYKPRSYYAGNPLLESYFRSMMWLGRITFRAKSELETLTGLMVLRALVQSSESYQDWQNMADVLNFMVGPMDDYSAIEYLPLAKKNFGEAFALDALADTASLTAFLSDVKELPGPRINSIPLPMGIEAADMDDFTRGFRLFGQRFTLDGYIMQQLIYPEVGTQQESRALPLGLDVAAALGSDIAYVLADEVGATAYANYTDNLSDLREEVSDMNSNAWLENIYGAWLWALQPLLVRDQNIVPPMMQTDAWKRKDIHTALANWTELKHATLLYAEQPMGGLGGGGVEPPVISTSYVEPNPLVFARIAIVATTLNQGLESRGFYETTEYTGLNSVSNALDSMTVLSARLAEISRRELAGEVVSYEDLYWMQESFGQHLWYIRYTVEEWITDPPENVALIADVASNANAETALEEAIGLVDYIYVIVNGPHGYHVTRGGVYSYYEFVQPIDQRMTDNEWREMVALGDLPPRPTWVNLYFSN